MRQFIYLAHTGQVVTHAVNLTLYLQTALQHTLTQVRVEQEHASARLCQRSGELERNRGLTFGCAETGQCDNTDRTTAEHQVRPQCFHRLSRLKSLDHQVVYFNLFHFDTPHLPLACRIFAARLRLPLPSKSESIAILDISLHRGMTPRTLKPR